MRIAFLSTKDIICDVPYLISERSAKKRIDILTNSTKQPSITVEFINGKFYFNNRFINFAALLTSAPGKTVLCNVVHFPKESEQDRLLRLLSNSFQESHVPWQVKYRVLQYLTQGMRLEWEVISEGISVSYTELKKFDMPNDIPDDIKKKAIEKNHGAVINEIYNCTYLSLQQKLILYSLAVRDHNRLTKDKFSDLKGFIRKGYFLTTNLSLLPLQIHDILEYKNVAKNNYWKSISDKYINNYHNRENEYQKNVLLQ